MTIEEKVIEESNNYFERSKNAITDADEVSENAHLAGDFIEKYLKAYPGSFKKILEIGCNYGYNLNYLSKRHGIEYWGIEPSDKAVEFGVEQWKDFNPKVHLEQGISNRLSYENQEFDVVMVDFFIYVTPREMIADTVLEVNRVLKERGFLILTDFDTPVFYKRVNKHNDDMPVYKEDYTQGLLSMGYSIAEKTSCSHGGDCFNPDIQKRVSIQFLYKEVVNSLYVAA